MALLIRLLLSEGHFSGEHPLRWTIAPFDFVEQICQILFIGTGNAWIAKALPTRLGRLLRPKTRSASKVAVHA